MTTRPDIPALLADALHTEVDRMTVTDSQRAAERLDRSMRRNNRTRAALVATAAAAVLVVAAGAALLGGDDPTAAPPPPAKKNATAQLPSPGHRIAVSGGDTIQLTTDTGGRPVTVLDGSMPAWSPDGSRLAYVDVEGNIALAEVSGWRSTALTTRADLEPGRGAEGPTWSSDGSRIAYTTGSSVRVADVATRESTTVRRMSAPFVGVSDWTPQGDSLLIRMDRSESGGHIQLYELPLDGTAPSRLLPGAGDTTGARYSPDGSRIAFFDDERLCICVAGADGKDVEVVHAFDVTPDTASVSWAPDGSALIWTEKTSNVVHLVGIDGTGERVITEAAGIGLTHDWS